MLWWGIRQKDRALQLFGDSAVVQRLMQADAWQWRWHRAGLLVAALSLIVFALAGPQLGTQQEEVRHEGFDLMIALDVSRSMLAEDVSPNRLERARGELKRLLPEIRGNRIGLVLFAEEATVQAPLTLDQSAIRLFLDVAHPDLIPLQGTNFNQLVTTLLGSFDDAPEQTGDAARAVLLVSDGENHVGDERRLARRLSDAGIVTFALGVGTTEGGRIPTGESGTGEEYHRDRDGNIVQSTLEPEILQTLARDGGYFQIGRGDATMDLSRELQRLDRAEFEAVTRSEPIDRYQWPLLLAIVLLGFERIFPWQREGTA